VTNIDTQNSQLVIHDFSNGKKIVYHLGGLPESGWKRETLIDGTKEVIQDWNNSLRLAFKGTDLERTGDYIELKIDGMDGVRPGKLGDLDRNYIWNFEKNMDSGLLGMSQAGPNPRSGSIEQNNVLMYGGNLLSSIGTARERALLQKEYEDLKRSLLDSGAVPDVLSGLDSAGDAAGSSFVQMMNQTAQRKMTRFSEQRNAPMVGKQKLSTFAKFKESANSVIQGQARDRGGSDPLKLSALNQITNKKDSRIYLQNIFRKALELKSTKDPMVIEALAAAEMLKLFNSQLTPQQKNVLIAQSRKTALFAEFYKNFNKGPNCALSSHTMSSLESDPNLLDEGKTPEVFKSWYKSTLLHEIGHSLGLTHNFKGSVDKKRFVFKGEDPSDKEARNYSSIMDYISDQFLKYKGAGLYDT
ncbi:MAG: zinc-dependent metalloprotease, partial [Pseudobdellovibrionaceae bacterium]